MAHHTRCTAATLACYATAAIGQHMTECLYVAGETLGRLQKCPTLLQGEVFTAAIAVQEFS